MEIVTICPERLKEGFKLFRNGRVEETSNGRFNVHSFSNKNYEVSLLDGSLWHCECADQQYNTPHCKHVYSTILFLTSRGIIR